ncbi:MAG: 3'(2'),5'-bisphosphate nucleotidase CysQ [Acidobacteria bacterium]|nr:3'(2'),5'-bisphosphate nucleotidase CysQ [Acidobacteriota bacterium]
MSTRSDLVAAGAGPWQIESNGDRVAHEFLVDELKRHRPDDGVLSEEGHDDRKRLERARTWIVDPLDGSSEYRYPNSVEFAVHVALTVNGRAEAGAVSLPAMGETYSTLPAPPHPRDSGRERPLVLVGRSRANIDGRRLASHLGADVAATGSAGVKAMLVVRGDADAYVHAGGLYEWDVCAPAVVAQAAGLYVSDALGDDLVFNRSDPWSKGIIVCRRDLAQPILEAL